MAASREPRVAADYVPGCSTIVRRTCLEIATRLGDFGDELRVVGGLVPSLIIDQANRAAGVDAHIGTIDLDLGLSIVVLDEQLYEQIAKRLHEAGFTPDENPSGNPTAQRWRSAHGTTVDFLIPPASAADKGGRLRNLDDEFAAIITPGLDLAFEDSQAVTIRDTLPAGGGIVERSIHVCGPGAYTVLKSLAFNNRGKPKDAYDLYYVIRNHAAGIEQIAAKIRRFGERPEVQQATGILKRDFMQVDSIGPVRVAEFLGAPDVNLQADVAGEIRALLDSLPS